MDFIRCHFGFKTQKQHIYFIYGIYFMAFMAFILFVAYWACGGREWAEITDMRPA